MNLKFFLHKERMSKTLEITLELLGLLNTITTKWSSLSERLAGLIPESRNNVNKRYIIDKQKHVINLGRVRFPVWSCAAADV